MAFVCLLLAGVAIRERSREPLGALADGPTSLTLLGTTHTTDSLTAGVLRHYYEVELLSGRKDTIRASVSLPPGFDTMRLPVVTILGGQEMGRKNFGVIPDPGKNILIIYHYPQALQHLANVYSPRVVVRTRRAIYAVPAQVLELIQWAGQQAWADPGRMPVLGYSFGALFQPAVYHLASRKGIILGPGVVAYGGADLELLIFQNLKTEPELLRGPLAWLAATTIYSMDPQHHAPHLSGAIYLINGKKDRQIPPASWRQLHRLVPGPERIDLLDEGHMHPDKPGLTLKLVRMSRSWLEQQNMLNP